MKSSFRMLSRAHVLRGKEKAAQALTILRMYRKDPDGNNFLRNAAEPVLRNALFHMRQAAILDAVARRLHGRSVG